MNTIRIMPQVKGLPLLGNLLQFKENPLAKMILWQQEYGDLLAFQLGWRKFYLLSDPLLVEQALIEQADNFIKIYNPTKPRGLELVLGQGLLTSRGSLWRRQRSLLQPVFQRRNMSRLYPQMIVAGEQLTERWRGLPQQVSLNMADEMMRLALEVLTRTMFSSSVMDKIDVIAPALDCCLRYAAKTVMNPFMLPLVMPTTENKQFKRALATLDDVIYQMIDRRRRASGGHDDLLTLLFSAADPASGEKMNVRQLRDEMITIFTAGHETTANVLTWTLYFLASNPGWQERVRRESKRLLNGQTPDFAQLGQLTECRAVLLESMRMRPPAGFLMRKVTRDTLLNGYPLKAEALAVISIYNIHHHPRLWDRPEQFEPDRFIGKKQSKSTFMPFGIGARYCIGNHFAVTELTLLLSMMLQHFEFTYYGPPPEMDMAVTIRPKDGINLTVTYLG